uniref:NADH dehydrogenase subunit 6 n=1 Tax=Periclimenes brevicarpalis TaxID=390963 RepID=UPI001FA7B2AF|nr:NADH dehydrogenase subunit 6 [Periclimenes brevicarpalis]UMY76330.1 NADH dehydrogenase subunit 6 [Periclimenes brevicarpalis]
MDLLTITIMYTSTIFLTLKHPLAMGLTLIFHTTIMCLLTYLSTRISWFAFILFYIFMGAVLVLFIYVSALASNEPFSMDLTTPAKLFVLLFTSRALYTILSGDALLPITDNPEQWDWLAPLIQEKEKTVTTIFSPSTFIVTNMIILFLLLTMVVVVKITLKGTATLQPNR